MGEALVADLKAGNFPRINIAFVHRREPTDFAIFALAPMLTSAGIMGRLIDLPKDSDRSGIMMLSVNEAGSRLGQMLWQKYRLGGGETHIGSGGHFPSDLAALLPPDENCLIVGENDAAFQAMPPQPGEGLDIHGRPVPAPQ
jgi:hypothetical protein